MNNRIITLLETMKNSTVQKWDNYLNSEDMNSIIEWYGSSDVEIEKAIDLMYYFYVRENLDMYPQDEYIRCASYISENYSINIEEILYKLTHFRKLVYGD